MNILSSLARESVKSFSRCTWSWGIIKWHFLASLGKHCMTNVGENTRFLRLEVINLACFPAQNSFSIIMGLCMGNGSSSYLKSRRHLGWWEMLAEMLREEKREEGDHWPAESTTAPLSSSSLLRHDLKKSQATSLFHSPLDGPSAMPKAIKKIRFFFPPKKESGKWLNK